MLKLDVLRKSELSKGKLLVTVFTVTNDKLLIQIHVRVHVQLLLYLVRLQITIV